MSHLQAYPSTLHLEGSKLPPGEPIPADQIRLRTLTDGVLVFEEKMDGTEIGLSYVDAERVVHSRGHIVDLDHPRYALLRAWTDAHEDWLFDVLGDRYTAYFMWMYARHTIFYDSLPHYALEFAVFDRVEQVYLTTACRRGLFFGRPIVSVPVVHTGLLLAEGVRSLATQGSRCQTLGWREALVRAASLVGQSPETVLAQSPAHDGGEGVFANQELGRVIGRFKFIRPEFMNALLGSGSHWAARPSIPNALAEGVDIFASALTPPMECFAIGCSHFPASHSHTPEIQP